jgi:hypothetical protein
LHPGRAAALLLEPGVVDHQNPAGVAKPLGHLGPKRVPHLVGVPAGMVEQPLHAVRSGVPGELRQGPPVLTFQPAQQTQQI